MFDTKKILEVHIDCPAWHDPSKFTLKQGDKLFEVDLSAELMPLLGVMPQGGARFTSFLDGLYCYGFDINVIHLRQKVEVEYEPNEKLSNPLLVAVGYAFGAGAWGHWKRFLSGFDNKLGLLSRTGVYYRTRPGITMPRIQFPPRRRRNAS